MTIRVHAMLLAVLSAISTLGLNGCSHHDSATSEARGSEAEHGGKRPQHVEGQTPGRKRHEAGDEQTPPGHEHADHKHHAQTPQRDRPGPAVVVKVGDRVPDFSVQTLDGKRVKLSELQKDKSRTKTGVVVLSFWCTTCHSCRHVEKQLAKLHKDHAGQAAVIALDANADDTAEGATAYVKKHALALAVVLDPSGQTADLFGTQRTTTTVVIDGDGVLRYCGQFRQKGGGSVEAALRAVLAGEEVAVKTTPHMG